MPPKKKKKANVRGNKGGCKVGRKGETPKGGCKVGKRDPTKQERTVAADAAFKGARKIKVAEDKKSAIKRPTAGQKEAARIKAKIASKKPAKDKTMAALGVKAGDKLPFKKKPKKKSEPTEYKRKVKVGTSDRTTRSAPKPKGVPDRIKAKVAQLGKDAAKEKRRVGSKIDSRAKRVLAGDRVQFGKFDDGSGLPPDLQALFPKGLLYAKLSKTSGGGSGTDDSLLYDAKTMKSAGQFNFEDEEITLNKRQDARNQKIAGDKIDAELAAKKAAKKAKKAEKKAAKPKATGGTPKFLGHIGAAGATEADRWYHKNEEKSSIKKIYVGFIDESMVKQGLNPKEKGFKYNQKQYEIASDYADKKMRKYHKKNIAKKDEFLEANRKAGKAAARGGVIVDGDTDSTKQAPRKFVEKASGYTDLKGIQAKPDVMGGLFNAAHIHLGNLIEKQFKDMNAEIKKYKTAPASYFKKVSKGGVNQYHTVGADALLVHQKLVEEQFKKAISLAPGGVGNPKIQALISSYNKRGKSGVTRARKGKYEAEQRLGLG